MPVERILQQLEDDMVGFLEEIAPGERIFYDLQIQLAPTPQGPTPIVLIMMSAPSGVLDAHLFNMLTMPLGQLGVEGFVKNQLRGGWQRMLEQRAEIMATNQLPAPKATQGPSQSGLILPSGAPSMNGHA